MPHEAPIDDPDVTRARGPVQDQSSTLDIPTDPVSGETRRPEPRPKPSNAAWPSIAGYEIVKELGRGGMGVVYLARHSHLKRLVALKMVRAGAAASPEELERFRIEGEAVARLQHPNIVQIFEVGDHAGSPFFALEYAEGGSMAAALAASRWTPERVVEVVETLARAVHHAHQKQVVHRDLKPANVLLAADGTPKITDFGLAKRLEDGDSGQTRTGAVMGTPSYMAPEQAAGRVHEIGPATDVYALGAILYECVTGRAPFKGTSVLDTLEMVRSKEPEPPRKLRPGVPRDLETICLKAMAKDPSARYSSTLALAQDLERYRSGEPILGRRVGVATKWVRKLRRNKAVALAGLAAVVAAGAVSAALLANRTSRETRVIEARIAAGLERPDLDAAAGDALEQDIARLAAADAERGRATRQKLVERFAEGVRAELRKPRVLEADQPAIQDRLAWLAAREPALAGSLAADLHARLLAWQTVVEAGPPFATVEALFPSGAVRIEAAALRPVNPFVPTRVSSLGTIRAMVEYDGEWRQASQLGVVFGHRPGLAAPASVGYAFMLRAVWPQGEADERLPPRPATFDAGGIAVLEILRDGGRLGFRPVTLRPGPVRIVGERRGDRVAVRLNDADTLEFFDPLPLPSVAGACVALHCPPEATVSRLCVEEQAVSPAASRLERADDLFLRGKTADALALYEAAAVDAAVSTEARYKAGSCLIQLGRAEEGVPHFEAVATGKGGRWGVVAAFQLWLVHLKAKRFDDADHVLATIKGNYPRETIANYVPVSIRSEIGSQFKVPTFNKLVFDPKTIPQYEAAIRLAETLQLSTEAIDRQTYPLVMAHGMAGDFRKARSIADAHLAALFDRDWHGDRPAYPREEMIRWHGWVARLAGEPNPFVGRAEGHFARPLRESESAEERRRGFLPFKLDAARRLAAQGKWEEAERRIDEFLEAYPLPSWDYYLYSQAHFMKGFARAQAKDDRGAAAAWKEGRFSVYKERFAKPPTDSRVPNHNIAIVETWAMQALTDTLSDEDAKAFFAAMTGSLGGDEVAQQVGDAMKIGPDILRGLWTSPRGRLWARRMAFLDTIPSDYYYIVPRLMLYEKLRQDAGVPLTEVDRDDAIWLATSRWCEALRTGEFAKASGLQMVLAYKGVTNLLGWGGLAPQLKSDLRGPVAYVLGLRYRKLNKPAEAREMFKTAAADAPAGSGLKKLAEAELANKK